MNTENARTMKANKIYAVYCTQLNGPISLYAFMCLHWMITSHTLIHKLMCNVQQCDLLHPSFTSSEIAVTMVYYYSGSPGLLSRQIFMLCWQIVSSEVAQWSFSIYQLYFFSSSSFEQSCANAHTQ